MSHVVNKIRLSIQIRGAARRVVIGIKGTYSTIKHKPTIRNMSIVLETGPNCGNKKLTSMEFD